MGVSAAARRGRIDAHPPRLAETDGRTIGGPANAMARRGIEPALLAAYLVIITEVLGAICITVGFLTRLVAALLVIEFLVIVKVHSAAGWMASAQGAEFPFIWLIVFVFILLRGGGPYSVDRKLGWEI
jgi:putative oxidoreductase